MYNILFDKIDKKSIIYKSEIVRPSLRLVISIGEIMPDTIIHQLTAGEIKGRDPEDVAKFLQENGVVANTYVVPEELYHYFKAPSQKKQAAVFAKWVGIHMIQLSQEAVPAWFLYPSSSTHPLDQSSLTIIRFTDYFYILPWRLFSILYLI
jgi:hypothetical protein